MRDLLAVECGSGGITDHLSEETRKLFRSFLAPFFPFLPEKTENGRIEKELYAYCFYCDLQHADVIAKIMMIKGANRAIYPMVFSRERKNGKLSDKIHPLLPGYIFVYMEERLKDFEMFREIYGIFRSLGGENRLEGLQGKDYIFARNLLLRDGAVTEVSIVKERETVQVLDPLFEHHSAEVLQIEHRKKRAKIRFQFDGQSWDIWVSCDIIYS